MMDEMSFDEAMYRIKIQIEEQEAEFVYTAITPFCESIMEKHLSKDELEKILRRGSQPSIPVSRLKELRVEAVTMNDISNVQMLDKLIAESEERYND